MNRFKKKQAFYNSETFFKYLGAAIGLSVSVALLISSQFVSLSSGALSIARDSYAVVESNLEGTKERFKQTAEDLKSAEENLATSEKRLRTMDSKLKERTQELHEVSAKLVEQSRQLALERHSGTTIYICEKPHIHGVYNMTSHINGLEPVSGSALGEQSYQMSMRIYVLRDGQLAFTAFARPPSSKFSTRRADGGDWMERGDIFELRLSSRETSVFRYDFKATDLLDFALGNSKTVCSTNNICFHSKPNCLP